jgi:hypothetical protein
LTAFGIQNVPSSWIGRFASWSYQATVGPAAGGGVAPGAGGVPGGVGAGGVAAPVGGPPGIGFCALPMPRAAASLSSAVIGGAARGGRGDRLRPCRRRAEQHEGDHTGDHGRQRDGDEVATETPARRCLRACHE